MHDARPLLVGGLVDRLLGDIRDLLLSRLKGLLELTLGLDSSGHAVLVLLGGVAVELRVGVSVWLTAARLGRLTFHMMPM
jgi:hypothetical protein